MDNKINRRSVLKKLGLGVGIFTLNFPQVFAKEEKLAKPDTCVLSSLRKGRKIIHRIVVTGDGHWNDSHITTAHIRLGKWANNIPHTVRHDRMINWINQETNTVGTDFVVFNGDLVTNRPQDLPIIKEQYNRLKAKYYVTHGNHDHSTEENWKQIWGYGRNHSFTFGNYAVILLNSSNEKGKYECADHVWLKSELDKFHDKAGILIFCHICQNGQGSYGTGIDCQPVTDVMLESKNLKLAVHSHVHRINGHYPIFKSLDEGGKQIDTFFSGHFSSWGLPYLGYRVIEIYDDSEIVTYAFDPAKNQILNWNEIK